MRSPLLSLRRAARAAALLAAILLAPLAFAGCPDPEPPPPPPTSDAGSCPLGYLGDPEADPQIEITALAPDYTSQPVAEGDTVSILFPPQGGRVIFAGVRATNVNPCAVEITGALRDTCSNHVRFDIRTVNLTPQGDGWGASLETDIASFANIPVCHNQWSDRDVFDKDYELTVAILDRQGKKAEKTILVRPLCDEPGYEQECLCICKQGYVLGEACPPDAGMPDGSTPECPGADGGAP